MKSPPSPSFDKELETKNKEILRQTYQNLTINCSSSPNIFKQLFKYKSDNKSVKFQIFNYYISTGADFNKELEEDKSMLEKFAEFIGIDYDDEEMNFLRENPLLRSLNKFKKKLILMQKLGSDFTSEKSKILYVNFISYLNGIISQYEEKLRCHDLKENSSGNVIPVFEYERFFSKNPPTEIENILSFYGFLVYLKDSEFIAFFNKSIEIKMQNIYTSPISPQESKLHDSLNNLIARLSKNSALSIDHEKHRTNIEKIKYNHNLKLKEFLEMEVKEQKKIREDYAKKESEKRARLLEEQKQKRAKAKKEFKEKKKSEIIKKKEEEREKKEEEEKLKMEDKERIQAKEKEEKGGKQAIKQQKKLIWRISEKPRGDFKKFKSFFDFLRKKSWLDIGEIGLFGSAVYKQAIKQFCSDETILDKPETDLDFFCIPKDGISRGIFKLCPNETAARINLKTLLQEFNTENSNLQISFLKEEAGKKSVNHGGRTDSLNFKLVATFYEDKVDEDKTEKIIKEQIEFDLNFYTQKSVLEKLQWQINIERVMFCEDGDGKFYLKLNQSDCDLSQQFTIEDFIKEIQNKERQNFLIKINPQARGFINRIINKKGVYKYLKDEELEQIKSNLVEEFSEKITEELEHYKKFISVVSEESDEANKAKKIEYEMTIKLLNDDPILSKLIKNKSLETSLSSPSGTQIVGNHLSH